MSKKKHPIEWYVQIAEEYLNGEGSTISIGKKYGLSHQTVSQIVQRYRENGIDAFNRGAGNTKYSKDFKIKCVEAVLSGEGSVDYIVAKYNISAREVLRSWIKVYNANMELKDYDPKREVYMAESRRKTTIEERKEITEYCINHNKDYKNTAALYDVSYSQVYTWVRKYEELGESGLIDKRGHHKTDDEVDDAEKLRRENKRLKRQLEEKEMEILLLKKVKELERSGRSARSDMKKNFKP